MEVYFYVFIHIIYINISHIGNILFNICKDIK